jgi:5,10-methylenetetrahydromethanopterin reductase
VILHRAADEAIAGLLNSSRIPAAAAKAVQAYVALARGFEPQDATYLMNHRGHLMFVKPEERPYVTAELIRDTSFTASATELTKRIADLRDAGYTQFVVQIVPSQEEAIEEWGRLRKALA